MASIHGWFRLSAKPQQLHVRSRLFELPEHYLDHTGRSARCGGEGCALCPAYERRLCWVAAVSPYGSPRVFLLKFPPGCAELAQQLANRGSALVGQILVANWVGKTAQEGLEIQLLGFEAVKIVPCERYIAAIGRRAYEVAAEAFRVAPELQLKIS